MVRGLCAVLHLVLWPTIAGRNCVGFSQQHCADPGKRCETAGCHGLWALDGTCEQVFFFVRNSLVKRMVGLKAHVQVDVYNLIHICPQTRTHRCFATSFSNFTHAAIQVLWGLWLWRWFFATGELGRVGGFFAQEPHKKQKGKLRGWVEKFGFSPMSEIEVWGTDFSFVLWKCYNSER